MVGSNPEARANAFDKCHVKFPRDGKTKAERVKQVMSLDKKRFMGEFECIGVNIRNGVVSRNLAEAIVEAYYR